MRLISRTLDLIPSPIGFAHELVREYQGSRKVLDLTQGAPSYPTAPVIANHIAHVAKELDGGRYTPRPGLNRLRELVATEISDADGGSITIDNVLITAGCNQAFCCSISAIAEIDDQVILPIPYYFNHDMWLRLDRITPVYLDTEPGFVPDPVAAERLITDKTKAIVLVTPGNPTGVTIPPSVIHEFYDLAKKYDLMLILDETYKVFRSAEGPAHRLFNDSAWGETVVSLHSFSKEFAIPGHRVGAVIAHRELIVEMMKLFECMSICAPRLGQEAVIEGLSKAGDWRSDRVREIREKQFRFETVFSKKPGGFKLSASGAFFGWVQHPLLNDHTNEVVRRLLLKHGILVLDGNIFTPTDQHYLRFSFGGLSLNEIDELGDRLQEFA